MQLRDGVGDALLVGGGGGGTELDGLVGDDIAQRIWLKDNRERQIRGARNRLCELIHKQRLVLLEPTVGGGELSGRLTGRTVTVRQIVQDKLHHLLLPGTAFLLACLGDGSVDAGEAGHVAHPDESAGSLHSSDAGSIERVILLEEGSLGLLELVGIVAVCVVVLAFEGVDILGRMGMGHDGERSCRQQREESNGRKHLERVVGSIPTYENLKWIGRSRWIENGSTLWKLALL